MLVLFCGITFTIEAVFQNLMDSPICFNLSSEGLRHILQLKCKTNVQFVHNNECPLYGHRILLSYAQWWFFTFALGGREVMRGGQTDRFSPT